MNPVHLNPDEVLVKKGSIGSKDKPDEGPVLEVWPRWAKKLPEPNRKWSLLAPFSPFPDPVLFGSDKPSKGPVPVVGPNEPLDKPRSFWIHSRNVNEPSFIYRLDKKTNADELKSRFFWLWNVRSSLHEVSESFRFQSWFVWNCNEGLYLDGLVDSWSWFDWTSGVDQTLQGWRSVVRWAELRPGGR